MGAPIPRYHYHMKFAFVSVLLVGIVSCRVSACNPGDYCMCTNNPPLCHLTKAPCSCSGPTPPPPPPAPSGTFQQLQCSDNNCQQNCKLNTYPMNKCFQTQDGGSDLIQTCNSEVTLISWQDNKVCSGTGQSGSMRTGVCLQDTGSGTSFQNICGSSYHPAIVEALYNTSAPLMTSSVLLDEVGMSAANHTGFAAGPSKCPRGDMFCEKRVGPSSYCKYWKKGPDGQVCQGSKLPCKCGGCKGDKFCQAKVGPSSYCKYWAKGAGKVCQYSTMPCNCK